MPIGKNSEPIYLNLGDVVIPGDIIRLRQTANDVADGITEAGLQKLRNAKAGSDRFGRALQCADAIGFALRLRIAISKITTPYDLRDFELYGGNRIDDNLSLMIIEESLLVPKSQPVRLGASFVQFPQVPDLIWVEGMWNKYDCHLLGRGYFKNSEHGLLKQLRLSRQPLQT